MPYISAWVLRLSRVHPFRAGGGQPAGEGAEELGLDRADLEGCPGRFGEVRPCSGVLDGDPAWGLVLADCLAVVPDAATVARPAASSPAVARLMVLPALALVEHLTSSVSNHGAKAVSATLDRMGVDQPSKLWLKHDGDLANWPALATAGRKSAAILDHWTKNRHAIVHEGVAIPVNGEHATQLINFIEALAKEIDALALAAISPV